MLSNAPVPKLPLELRAMSASVLLLTAGFAGLVALGIPFAIAIGVVVTLVLVVADIEPAFLAQQLVAGSQSFSLLAIPLFMLAGELMTAGGLSQRLSTSPACWCGTAPAGSPWSRCWRRWCSPPSPARRPRPPRRSGRS